MGEQVQPSVNAVRCDRQAAHGLLLLLSFSSLALVPQCMRLWPFSLLIPLVVYGCVVSALRPLRETTDWLRIGRINGRLIGLTAAVSALSCMVLVCWQILASPSLDYLNKHLPFDLLGNVLVTAAVFTLLNPVLEEIVFRGVFYQAIAAYWSWPVAVLGSSVIFGVGHTGGYPPGVAGAVLAGVYGIALGAIRHHSRGLLLPVLAHIAADGTIAGIRIYVSQGLSL
jgi:membrane protease YdiL (CAAX protease family)